MLILLHSHIFGDIEFLLYLTLSLTISLPNQHHSTPTLFHISIIMVQFKRTSQNRTSLTSLPSMYPANQQQWMPNSSHQQTSSLSGLKIALVALCLILPWIPYATVRIIFNAVESRVSSLLEQRQTLAQDLGHIIHRNNKLQGKDQEYDIGQWEQAIWDHEFYSDPCLRYEAKIIRMRPMRQR